jgi:chromosome segregation ATPase
VSSKIRPSACSPSNNRVKLAKDLQKLWDEQQRKREATSQHKALEAEYSQLLSRQQQLRQNLGALGKSEREATIRDRILDDLETSENRRRELETELAGLDEQIKQHQLAQQTLINEIYKAE